MVPVAARRRARVVLDDPGYGLVDHAYLQGVAADLGLAGFVRARRGPVGPEGLCAEVEGEPDAVLEFVAIVRHGSGGGLTVEDIPPLGGAEFAVLVGHGAAGGPDPLAPDAGLCGPCRIELFDRSDRRFRHPFAGCARCGPAYTLLVDPGLPTPGGGRRAATTMAPFGMCAVCRDEYDDPRSRRYGAPAVCCPACGPRVAVLTPHGAVLAGELVRTAVRVLMEDQVLAVKEPGGWQLWADGGSVAGVAALRGRLGAAGIPWGGPAGGPPAAEPFAAMCADLDVATEWFVLEEGAATALTSRRRPRVMLRPREAGRALAPALAPGRREVAVSLPASGLAHLLAHALRRPIAVTDVGGADPHHAGGGNDEARRRLGGVADAFLAHELAIGAPAAESVVRVVAGREVLLRRGRGHGPEPIGLPWVCPRPVLALGTDAAATPCLAYGRRAVLLPEPGHPPDGRAAESLRAAADRLRVLTGVEPAVVAHDPDPAAVATAYAHALAGAGLFALAVPRAPAYVAACLADNGAWGPAVGVALGDGCRSLVVGDLARLEEVERLDLGDDPARAVVSAVAAAHGRTGLGLVALSGALFAEGDLLAEVLVELTRRHFRVLTPARVALGEAGLALGQAVLAAASRSR